MLTGGSRDVGQGVIAPGLTTGSFVPGTGFEKDSGAKLDRSVEGVRRKGCELPMRAVQGTASAG